MKTTKFFELTVIHPESGKVNRSVISRIIRNLSNGYNNSDKENVKYLRKFDPANTLVLSDVNYQIKGSLEYNPNYA
jgi:hypothetical protein